MAYDYDLAVVGLGPAGMAVAIMSSEMGLKVCAIEKEHIGGECMNVGCIPSKALLRAAKTRNAYTHNKFFGLSEDTPSNTEDSLFPNIANNLHYISEKKVKKMFDKTDLIYQQGSASFIDEHTLQIGTDKTITAKRIFLCTGTRPAIPDFPGISDIDVLTNENMFTQDHIPESLIVIGGGAIACEMAQAFSRLGSKVTMIIRGKALIWRECERAYKLLEEKFTAEGITILKEQSPTQFTNENNAVIMETSSGEKVTAEKVLVAAGREYNYSSMNLESVGVKLNKNGSIKVNRYLQTASNNIYACGDCNGYKLFSHAAMHQGMLALMNSMNPLPIKFNYRNYVVPWTIFSEPQISHVGPRESELIAKKKKFTAVEINYADYGAAIAEDVAEGFLRALISPTGKILAVTIAGEGSGEMINEWALAIQKKIRITDIMFLQHSFPTMGFLTKRVSEEWMMGKMQSSLLQKAAQIFFRLNPF